MNDAIAMRMDEYYPTIFPKVYERKLTAEHKGYALDTLYDYNYNEMITDEMYEQAKTEIENAQHDDEISNIMTKVRKKANWDVKGKRVC